MGAMFTGYDARTLARANIGIAGGNPASSIYLNPAILATQDERKFFLVPALYRRIADSEGFLGSALELGDDIKAFESASSQLQTDTANLTYQQTYISAANDVLNGLAEVSNKPVERNQQVTLQTGVTSNDSGWAIFVSSQEKIGLELEYATTDTGTLQNMITSAASGTPIQFTASALSSSSTIQAIRQNQLGFAYAGHSAYRGRNYAWGVTSKLQSFDVRQAELSNDGLKDLALTAGAGPAEPQGKINFDLGLITALNQDWSGAVVVKDLLPQKLTTRLGDDINLKPTLRIGTAYQNQFAQVNFDLDVNRSSTFGIGSDSRFFGVSGVLQTWGFNFNAGYRFNLDNSTNNLLGLGVGFGLFGLELHAGAALANVQGVSRAISDRDIKKAKTEAAFAIDISFEL
jgi:hypothetical protein